MGTSYGDFTKYPRTPHLFGSKGTEDDKHMCESESLRFISDASLIVEEKLDGTNVGIHFSESGELVEVVSRLIGTYNFNNIMTAIALGKYFKVPAHKIKAAIEEYQRMHPHLTVDGVLGPATIAQLRRDAQALRDATTKGGGLTSGATILSYLAGLPWGWIAIGVVVLAAGYFAWRYRDVIRRRWNTWRAG